MPRAITTRRQPRASGRSKRRGRSTRSATGRSSRSPRPSTRSSNARTRSTRRARAQHEDEVQEFLEDFTFLLTSGNGQGAAARFELPTLMVMADPKYGPSQLLDDRDKTAAFFGKAPEMYAQKGIASTIPQIEELRWLRDGFGLVQVRFPYIDAHGNDLGDAETSLYLLRRNSPGDFAITGVVALGTDSDIQAARRKRPIGEVGEQRASLHSATA